MGTAAIAADSLAGGLLDVPLLGPPPDMTSWSFPLTREATHCDGNLPVQPSVWPAQCTPVHCSRRSGWDCLRRVSNSVKSMG